MEDVFNDQVLGQQAQEEPAETPAQEAPAPETQSTAEPTGQPEGGATAAHEDGKHVPLAALEAERKGRQDWKEKALRYEGELKAMRERQQPQGEQQQGQWSNDPLERMQQLMISERFNNSEQLVRMQFKDAGDVDDMVNLFSAAAEKNPALIAQMHNQRHPWLFAYEEGKRLKLAQEMGSDPEAYRKKLRDEIEAQVRAELGGAAPQSNPDAPKPVIPGSLAGARSAAPRSAATFTGPAPINSLFTN